MKKLNLQIELGIFAAFLVGFLLYMGGCKGSLQDILNEYNSYYIPTKDERIPPKPGDPDFSESEMLFPTYYICEDGSVNLAAPECNTYKWELRDKQDELLTSRLKFYENSGPEEREFRFYLPLSYPPIEVGTYKITLEIMDEAGTVYSDTAMLVIYENIN